MRKHSHLVCGTLLSAFLGTLCAWGQQPPPPPPAAPAAPAQAGPPPGGPPAPVQPGMAPGSAQQPFFSNDTIRSWNYGPNGDINGFTLDRNVLVMVPPDFGARLANVARLGSRISVSGYGRSGVNVPNVVDAQVLNVNGQTLNVGATAGAPPLPPGGPSVPARARRGPPPPPPGPAGAPPSQL